MYGMLSTPNQGKDGEEIISMKKNYETPTILTVSFDENEVMTVSYGDNFGGLLPEWGNP
jgi:hypothetical protein